ADRVGEGDRELLLRRVATDAQSDLGDDAGRALGVGYPGEVGPLDDPDLAVAADDPGRNDVLAEPAVGVATDAGAALGEPAADSRARGARRIETQRQPTLLQLRLEVLPDRAGADGRREGGLVDRDEPPEPGQVEHQAAVGR